MRPTFILGVVPSTLFGEKDNQPIAGVIVGNKLRDIAACVLRYLDGDAHDYVEWFVADVEVAVSLYGKGRVANSRLTQHKKIDWLDVLEKNLDFKDVWPELKESEKQMEADYE